MGCGRHGPGVRQLGSSPRQARNAYRKFIEDGQRLGHQKRYYETVGQRFLGDEKFVQQIANRAPQGDVKPRRPKIRFEKLLHAVAQVRDCSPEDLSPAAAGLGCAAYTARLPSA